jgi:single-stranded DNA-binding protein
VAAQTCGVGQQRREPLHPPADADVVDLDTSLGEQLGRLRTRSWETPEGEKRSVTEIDADEVAPSLRWVIARPERAERSRNGQRSTERGQVNDEPPFQPNLIEVMVKIRLEGTAEECQQATVRLAEVFDVVSISDPYRNRGRSRLVRVYVEVRSDNQRHADHDEAAVRRPRATIHRAGRELPSP